MVESKDVESKALARDFISYVQLKEILKKQFIVYNQLNSSYIKDLESAKIFVSETLSILEKFQFEDILSYNHLLETRFEIKKMKPTDINLHISKLIKYETSTEKYDQAGYVESLNAIVEHVSTFRDESNMLSELNSSISNSELKFLQPKHVIKIALKKFNDRYSDKFDDEDRFVFNTLREGNERKILKLYNIKIKQLQNQSILDGEDFSDKLQEAIRKVGTGYTQDNLLNAHELCSELIRLREGT